MKCVKHIQASMRTNEAQLLSNIRRFMCGINGREVEIYIDMQPGDGN